MTTLIIIATYILTIFISRLLNKYGYKNDKYTPKMVGLWFVPFINIIATFTALIISLEEMDNNFTGKNW